MSSVMDMMTQGGPPPDAGGPPPEAPPPPDLAAALGIGPTGQPQPPAGIGPGGPLSNTPSPDSATIVSQMLDLSQSYLSTEQDHEDLLSMQKISTDLQALLAKDQQDADAAMSGSLKPRVMRKAFASSGAAGPAGP